MTQPSKKEMRKAMLTLRDKQNLDELQRRSSLIHEQLFQKKEYRECKKLLTFVNFGTEVNTTRIIKDALSQGKTVAVPLTMPQTKEMVFIAITDMQNLKLSHYGILEPVFSPSCIVENDLHTLILVPGVAFDKKRYRLGYGGGYYDRYMQNRVFLKSIGLSYHFQIVEEIPMLSTYDIAVDEVITDGVG